MTDLKNSQLDSILPIEYDLPSGPAGLNDQGREFRLVVVIPAYNEARFIGSTVQNACEYSDCVLVVDDGSQDETALLAQHADAPQAFDFFFSETRFLSIGNRSHWQLV